MLRPASAIVAVTVLLVSGCGADESQTVDVFAAASLTETFTELAERFEAEHDDVTVRLSFGPSSGLATQIAEGAPAEVFAAASPETMATVTDARDDVGAEVFARNRGALVVPRENPAGIRGPSDLRKAALAVCAPQVPCGQVARELLDEAGVTTRPVTEEPDVKGVLAKVALGEVDAGVVYRTDAQANDDVTVIELPGGVGAETDYEIAALRGTPARDFVDLVTSEEGREVLADAGFAAP